MQSLPTALHAHVDYLVFSVLALGLSVFLHRRFWRSRGMAALGWVVTLSLLGAGWYTTETAGQRERMRMQQMVEGYAPTYAREMERMGHESINLQTDPDDPLYWQMIQAEKRWLAANPSVNDIYTLRKLPDGRTVLLVDSETDYDHNGVFEGEREQRTPIGEVYEEVFAAIEQACGTGKPCFEKDSYTDRWGTWVSAAVPLRDRSGRVDAVLGVDFDAAAWTAAIRRARLTMIGYFTVLGLIAAGLSGAASHRIAVRDLAARKRQHAALELEKRKLETLVNSIDGIVWECEVPSYHFTFVSQQSERILGYTPERWMTVPGFWQAKLHPEDAWAFEHCAKMVARKRPYHYDYRMIAADGRTVWIRESAAVLLDEKGEPVLVRGVFRAITEQNNAAEELEQTHRALVESSRQAGMAEVATGVLHNVGNVLNSVNVSGNVVSERLLKSKIADLRKIADLLTAHGHRFGEFAATDPRGKFIPTLVARVTEALTVEQSEIETEMRSILKNIDHIKEIVAMQQGFAKVGGVLEPLEVPELVEDALRINAVSLNRHEVEVVRCFAPVPSVFVDKHRVLQILVNLIRNAKQAMEEGPSATKMLTLSIEQTTEDRVRISVRDTGSGIAPENLHRIFNHGFTTKKTGHGFGLHSGALAASEMGGTLSVQSDGPGTGATFTLDLPVTLATASQDPIAQAA
jgi:PAS domain S-box-containing protein